jgi:hypothetical protein
MGQLSTLRPFQSPLDDNRGIDLENQGFHPVSRVTVVPKEHTLAIGTALRRGQGFFDDSQF